MTAPATSARMLVVDDEPDLRTLYEMTLVREGHHVMVAADLKQARQCLAEQGFDVMITDMRLPDGTGLELLREVTTAGRHETCIVITAYGSAENAVEALKAGAFDYLTKPVDLKQLRAAVATALRARHTGALRIHDALAPHDPRSCLPQDGTAALRQIVGVSACMQQVRARIAKVATSMAPILVQGESGTGKELVARAVHACSHRAHGPFVAVNCGAIPEHLIEAEFFGARKGAYTGSTQDRVGYFQAAHGGTLFLDEIGDLPLAMQAKLLRAIQERRIRPLGSVHEEAVDVRLVSATHRDLAARVQQGEFRQDLFYRLNVIELRVPPLRERTQDLPELAHALLQRLCAESGHAPPPLSAEALEWLQSRDLPGNVRELENLLQRALALSSGEALVPSDFDAEHLLPAQPHSGDHQLMQEPSPAPIPDNLQRYLDEQERRVLMKALQETDFNRTAAAARLGLNLRQIRYRIQRLGIAIPGGDDGR